MDGVNLYPCACKLSEFRSCLIEYSWEIEHYVESQMEQDLCVLLLVQRFLYSDCDKHIDYKKEKLVIVI